MKNLLSILGTTSLIACWSSNLIACDNNKNINKNEVNNNKKSADPKQNHPKNKSEQPPENSNWKLVDGFINEKNNDNKNYIGIIKIEKGWKIINWIGKRIDYKYQYKSIYRWDGIDKPNTPIIDSKTGQITNWKL